MVTVDDGRGGEAKRRLQIFMFDEETHRASRYIPLRAGRSFGKAYISGRVLLDPPGVIVMLPRCDTRDSPVVIACRKALETGNVNYALVRVLPSVEPELTAAFERAMRARRAGGDARDLADDRFFETAVRLNRAGEGEPCTELKPAGLDEGPVVPRAETALWTGDPSEVIGFVLAAVDEDLRTRFDRVVQTKGYDVRAGRAFVQAHLDFVVFAHHLYGYVTGGGGHPR